MTLQNKDDATIGLKTKVRLDVLIAVAPVIAGLVMIYAKLNQIEQREKNAWTVQEQIIYSERLQTVNANLKTPNISDIVNLMQDGQTSQPK